jgi:SAM-dependent methyltransferase
MNPQDSDDEHLPTMYDLRGERYGEIVDTQPHNAYFERPATLSLLPPLAGRRVLDAGSGNGWYAEHLLGQGATVTAFDGSATMVALTRARVGDRAVVLQADLAAPLAFAADASFDLVIAPLALHYVEDWHAVFAEFGRVLLPGGRLVFSTHHPSNDFNLHQPPSYFDTLLLEETWGELGPVRFYRRPLTAMADALAGAGFVIERILEPRPTEQFLQASPAAYAELMRFPAFLHFRARRD